MTAIAPPPQLSGLLEGYSDYAERTGSFTTRRELPHAQGVLLVNLAEPHVIVSAGRELMLKTGEAFVAGAHLEAALSRSRGRQAGMHVFLPLSSLRRLVGMPMERLLNQVVPLNVVLGVQNTAFCQTLVEARDLSERIALLDAALAHRFAATRRLLKCLSEHPAPAWAALAHDAGYCDQPHMIREFREFAGMTPGEHLCRSLPDGGGLVER